MSNIITPKEIAADFCKSGIYKAQSAFSRFALLIFLGGVFIAFGGLLSVIVAGGMPGVMAANQGLVKFVGEAMFPIGLMMVSVAGADLYTSNCTAMVLPVLKKKLPVKQLFKVWF
ncbi:MAG: formate/nitrite transporter family protein [Prevotellaceae bacterium]|jgi:formate/nitrite transporter FocA (FNT family)|nr:formate/nitrite transporter family protein [Prevotellaceae bacterium]